jgi:hypothetical protein
VKLSLDGKIVLGFFGSFYPYEGLDILLDAIALLRQERNDIAVILAGGGPAEEELKWQALRLGIEDCTTFLGLGYVGLPMAAIMATRGIEVVGVDVTPSVVAEINEGGIHIVEPGLDIVVRGAVAAGKLHATATPEPADAFIIAVPTPFKDGYVPDVSYCEAAARAIAPVVKAGDLVGA